MYKVETAFKDKKDNGYEYEVGDEYPREGGKLTKTRAKELCKKISKKSGKPFLMEVIDEDKNKESE